MIFIAGCGPLAAFWQKNFFFSFFFAFGPALSPIGTTNADFEP